MRISMRTSHLVVSPRIVGQLARDWPTSDIGHPQLDRYATMNTTCLFVKVQSSHIDANSAREKPTVQVPSPARKEP